MINIFRICRKNNITPICIITAVFIFILSAFPEKASDYARNGIILWYKSILPVMLPFLTAAILSSEIGLSDLIARIFSYPLGKLAKISGYGAFAVICAVLSGYPTGAKITAKLIHDKKITLSEGKKILIASDITSPAFIVGAVGVNMFGSKRAGILILICHYISALFLCILVKGPKTKPSQYLCTPKSCKKTFAAALSDSAASASETLISVCCFIMIFSIISGFITDFKILPSTFLGNSARIADSLLISSIEMTNGCHLLSYSVSAANICAVCAAISFGGFCVYFQILSVTCGSGIKPSYVLFIKVIHAILSTAIFLIIFTFIICK